MRKKSVFVLLLLLLSGCGEGSGDHRADAAARKEARTKQTEEQRKTKEETPMKILVRSQDHEIIYEINESRAAQELYQQLPLTLEVQDFSTNEKIFYPPEKLDIGDAPMADAKKGTLAYYSPWADVVMFYDDFGKGSSLYELGTAVSGEDAIEKLSGQIEVLAMEE